MPNFSELEKKIEKFFPGRLNPGQMEQMETSFHAYVDWNSKVNLISRKDLENLAERHFLHSLAIAHYIDFSPETQVLDVGTGGGFPGIPLAIFFPEVKFHLVDSISKKIRVVEDVAAQCGLENVRASAIRAEQVKDQYDFVVSRAVARLKKFLPWIKGRIHCRNKNPLPNGLLYLKGHTIHEELEEIGARGEEAIVLPLDEAFDTAFFSSKCLVHIPFCKYL